MASLLRNVPLLRASRAASQLLQSSACMSSSKNNNNNTNNSAPSVEGLAYGGVDIRSTTGKPEDEIDVIHWNPKTHPATTLSNTQLLKLIDAGRVRLHKLEDDLGDATRAVEVRRQHLARALANNGVGSEERPATSNLPYKSFSQDSFYQSILGTNCEAVIGYVEP